MKHETVMGITGKKIELLTPENAEDLAEIKRRDDDIDTASSFGDVEEERRP